MYFKAALMLVFTVCDPWMCVQCIQYDAFHRKTELPGQVEVNKHILDTKFVVSALDCARLCGKMPTCFGYKFEKNDKTCQVRSSIKDNIQSGDIAESTIVTYTRSPRLDDGSGEATDVPNTQNTKGSSVEDFASTTSNSNFNHRSADEGEATDVPNTQKDTRGSSVEDVTITNSNSKFNHKAPACGEAPDVPNAQKDTKGHSVGDVTIYTCKPDFVKCPKKRKESVCLPTGQWEKITELCERFRWFNLKTIGDVKDPFYELRFPCGPIRRFTATVRITPGKTRFVINLTKEKHILLGADYRLRFGGKVNTLILSSKINNRWQDSSHHRINLTAGTNITVIISLYRGKYKVDTDGSVCESKSRNHKYLPTLLIIGSDVHADFAEIIRQRRPRKTGGTGKIKENKKIKKKKHG